MLAAWFGPRPALADAPEEPTRPPLRHKRGMRSLTTNIISLSDSSSDSETPRPKVSRHVSFSEPTRALSHKRSISAFVRNLGRAAPTVEGSPLSSAETLTEDKPQRPKLNMRLSALRVKRRASQATPTSAAPTPLTTAITPGAFEQASEFGERVDAKKGHRPSLARANTFNERGEAEAQSARERVRFTSFKLRRSRTVTGGPGKSLID